MAKKRGRDRDRGERRERRPAPSVQQITATAPTVTDEAGTVWRLGFNSNDAKGRLEELIRAGVIRDAVRTKRAVGGPDGDDYFAVVQALVDAGHYFTFAKGWRDKLRSPDGAVLFLQSLLQEHHPEVTRREAEDLFLSEPEQVMAAVGVIAPDFFRAVAEQMGATPKDADAAAGELADAVATILAAAAEEGRRRTATPARPEPTPTPPATPAPASAST
jgi:hypothetical protein